MEEGKRIYRGVPESARALQDYLEQHGVESVLESHEEIGVRSRTRMLARQDVIVGAEHRARAETLRDQWQTSTALRARGLSRRAAGVIMGSLIPVGVWFVCERLALDGVPEFTLERGIGVWFVTVVVLGQIESQRRAAERIEMP